MTALIVGAILASCALAFVLWPLFAVTDGVTGDPAEALVNAARNAGAACGRCGSVPPEPDAIYCSSCGADLAGEISC